MTEEDEEVELTWGGGLLEGLLEGGKGGGGGGTDEEEEGIGEEDLKQTWLVHS